MRSCGFSSREEMRERGIRGVSYANNKYLKYTHFLSLRILTAHTERDFC
jgi:hypothetical protein